MNVNSLHASGHGWTNQKAFLVYKNFVRSQLDYCNSVWTPYRKSGIEALEKVQKGN